MPDTPTSQTIESRLVEGRELPPVGTWVADPVHSSVEFAARHVMVAKVRGGFADFSATVSIGERPEGSSVEAVIRAASIRTGDAQRDEHLRSPDFLDVERFPELTFRSSGVRPAAGDRWVVDGLLTIRDVARPVTLDVELLGVSPDPWGNVRAGFSASTEIDREDYGLTWNQLLDTGGVLVGRKVRIELELSTVRQRG